jgi:hypothetical protein
MKKVIILAFLVMFLTGCTAEVNVIINDTGINETVTIVDGNTEAYRNFIPAFYTDVFSDVEPDVKNSGIRYYDKTITQGVGGFNINYSHKFTLEEYKKARTTNTAFKSFLIRKNNADKQIIFSTETAIVKYFNMYPDLQNLKVNVISSYPVIDSNADYVNNNVYTWVFDRNTRKHFYLVLNDPNAPDVPDFPVVDSGDNNDVNSNISDNENDDNNIDGSSADSDDEESNDSVEDTKIEEEKKSFIDKYPIIILIGCIGVFLIFLLMLVKVAKVD